ncbi:hypothetical protein SAMN04489731_113182 [Amycolatopsis regifaucium]|nr:hypothetical protein SAMN04489731_113182 [Amycolatopsis regifaucium]
MPLRPLDRALIGMTEQRMAKRRVSSNAGPAAEQAAGRPAREPDTRLTFEFLSGEGREYTKHVFALHNAFAPN